MIYIYIYMSIFPVIPFSSQVEELFEAKSRALFKLELESFWILLDPFGMKLLSHNWLQRKPKDIWQCQQCLWLRMTNFGLFVQFCSRLEVRRHFQVLRDASGQGWRRGRTSDPGSGGNASTCAGAALVATFGEWQGLQQVLQPQDETADGFSGLDTQNN